MYFPQEIFEEIVSYTGTYIKKSNKFLLGHVYFSVPLDSVHNKGYNVEVVRFKVMKRTPKTMTIKFLKTTRKLSFDIVGVNKKLIKTIQLQDDTQVESITLKCEEYSTTITAFNEMLYSFNTHDAYKSFSCMYSFEGIVMRHLRLICDYGPSCLLRLWMILAENNLSNESIWCRFFMNNYKIMYEARTDLRMDDSFSPIILKNRLDLHEVQSLYIRLVLPHFRDCSLCTTGRYV